MLHDDCTHVQNSQGARRVYFKIFVIESVVIKLGLFKELFLKMVYVLSTNMKFAKSVNFFSYWRYECSGRKFSIRRLTVAIYYVTMGTFDSVNV